MSRKIVAENAFTEFEFFLHRQFDVFGLEKAVAQRVVRGIIDCYRLDKLNTINNTLNNYNVNQLWNIQFQKYRPKVIVDWIKPYCEGTVLDLISGDGNVGRELSNQSQKKVIFSDFNNRSLFYTKSETFITYDNLLNKYHLNRIDTVLLIAVLHHSLDPELLLKQAFEIGETVIIIENIIDHITSAETHKLVDIFFDQLNPDGDLITFNHKSDTEWVEMISRYGNIIFSDEISSVPGVELTHKLYITKRRSNI
jgi:hypothetical protein